MNIKLRAWDESQKYMAYQGTPDLETIKSFMHHFGDSPLMLHINSNDCNGKEVYAGDILEAPSGGLFVVTWHEEELCWVMVSKDTHYGMNMGILKVVGNIYENPELLPI